MSQNTNTKEIYTEVPNRNVFFEYLKQNPGIMIFKFGAEWCGPCKKIQSDLEVYFANCPNNVLCFDIDVDECFDIYAFLKSKKMINGIPAILAYKKGNETFSPDYSHSGSDLNQLNLFFQTIYRDCKYIS